MTTSKQQAPGRSRSSTSTRWFLVLLLLLVGFAIVVLPGRQQARADRHNLSPSAASTRGASQERAEKIAESATQQIQALIAEKESRTPAQQKIDSQLIYATKMRRGESIAQGVPSLDVDVGTDANGRVTVDITAVVDQDLLSSLSNIGIEYYGVFPQYHTLRADVSLDQLETIAALSQVRFIQPKQRAMFSGPPPPDFTLGTFLGGGWLRPAFSKRAANVRAQLAAALGGLQDKSVKPIVPNTGSVVSQGDTSHKASNARATFGANGAGVRIGVLSDSVDHLKDSQATNDLGLVTVLPGQVGVGIDEGTAMLEIIHDLAPGAQLYFATGNYSIASFADNIRALRAAGCDIIVDDINYFNETPFQNGQAPSVISTSNGGVVIQAVNDVTAAGALYFSAAGNSGNKNDLTSGTWEGDFVDGGALTSPPATGFPATGKVHDFDPTAAVSQFDTITLRASSGDSTIPISLFWSDPLGASNNDYDLFVLNSGGTSVLGASTDIQSGTQDPFEQVSATGTNATNNRIVILQKTGAANRFLHLATNRARLQFNTEGETHGHNAVSTNPGFYCVAAVQALGPPFTASNTVETFSSDGPRRIFFNADSSAITPGNFLSTGGSLLQKPDVTAADGVNVTGVGGFGPSFFGTSAAAPHAAAIAGLLKSARPSLTAAQVRTALTTTAIDIETAGVDRDAGAGIIMALESMQSLSPATTASANFEPGTVTVTESGGNANGIIEPGESATLNVPLTNTGVGNATGVTTTLTTVTPNVNIINGASAYPNLAVAGNGTNTTPFSFSLGASAPCDLRIDFTLAINYTGGESPKLATFSVQIAGRGTITTTLDTTTPTLPAGYPVGATGTQTGRLNRFDPPSSCGSNKDNPGRFETTPGVLDTVIRRFDAYHFKNPSAASTCVTVTLTNACAATQLQSVAYLNSFDPANVATNYRGDIGATLTNGTSKDYSFNVPGNAVFIVVVDEVTGGASGSGCGYTIQVSGLCPGGEPPPAPTPTPTPTPTPAATPTPTPTPTSTPTPTPGCATFNIFQDPGFEASVQGASAITNPFWNSTSTQFITSLCTVAFCGGGSTALPRNGTYWSWFGGTDGPENGTISQSVTIPAGATSATLNYFLFIGAVTAPFTDVLNIKVDGTTVQTITEPSVADAGYNQRSVNLNSFANGASHTILFEYISPLGGGTGNFNVDDVTLDICQPGAPTPTPTPIPTPTPTPTPTPIPTPTPVPACAFTANLGSPTVPGVTGTLATRLFRGGVQGTCNTNAFPTNISSGSFPYDAYTYTNSSSSPVCVTAALTVNSQSNANYQIAAFLAPFSATDITNASRYLGDSGVSSNIPPENPQIFQFTVPGNTSFVIVVFSVDSGTVGLGGNYTFTLSPSGVCPSGAATPTPTPTATPTPSATPTPLPTPGASQIVISQIYGGGGTPGATYRNSYIEVFNRGNTTVDLNNYTFEFASTATGNFDFGVSFSVTGGILLQPGQHGVLQLGSSGSNGAVLAPDLTIPPPPSTQFILGSSGKIAITKPGTTFITSPCPLPNSNIVDFVGFGSGANCFEGGASAPTLTNTTAAFRKGNGCNDADNNANDFLVGVPSPRNAAAAFTPCALQFSAPTYSVQEDCTFVNITVNRTGDISSAATVDYTTADGTATARRDYITAVGTLTFAPGETSKTFAVLINEDSYVEGNETFTVNLSNPSNVSLGTSVATVTILDDPSEPATNAIDDTPTFVCQQYHDFLNRQADAPGQAFWTNEITSCGANAACIEVKRINTSGAFYLSIEFQQTGYLVERLYKTAYGAAIGASSLGGTPHTLSVPIIRLNEFLPDTQRIGQGVVVGQGDWQTALENNKQAFCLEFVQRSRFATAFPTMLTPAQFVDALNANAGNVLSASERTTAINLFGGAGDTTNQPARAQALRQIAEDPDLVNSEFNRAFVLMQYFGYLRRDPNATPDSDYAGFEFWLTKLNAFNGSFLDAEMVKAFLSSIEYRQRFGP